MRWRLKTGLTRLREALEPPPRRRAWVLAGTLFKGSVTIAVIVVILLAVIALWLARSAPVASVPAVAATTIAAPATVPARPRPVLETRATTGGILSGRVVSTSR